MICISEIRHTLRVCVCVAQIAYNLLTDIDFSSK